MVSSLSSLPLMTSLCMVEAFYDSPSTSIKSCPFILEILLLLLGLYLVFGHVFANMVALFLGVVALYLEMLPLPQFLALLVQQFRVNV